VKIKLFSGQEELCVLKSLDDPVGVSPRAIVAKILEYFRDGEWIWINDDACAVRYDSVTKVEIVPESSAQELSEASS
jgi:hypothetical protein